MTPDRRKHNRERIHRRGQGALLVTLLTLILLGNAIADLLARI